MPLHNTEERRAEPTSLPESEANASADTGATTIPAAEN